MASLGSDCLLTYIGTYLLSDKSELALHIIFVLLDASYLDLNSPDFFSIMRNSANCIQ